MKEGLLAGTLVVSSRAIEGRLFMFMLDWI